MALRDRLVLFFIFIGALAALAAAIEEMRLYPYASAVLFFFAVSIAGYLLFYNHLSPAAAVTGTVILTIGFILLPIIEGSDFLWPAVILAALTAIAALARLYAYKQSSS